jgi:YVTN family beta-propeller protein
VDRRLLASGLLLLLLILTGGSARRCAFHQPQGHALFSSPQVAPLALSADGRRLYVANTTSNSVSVVDTASRREVDEIPVGLEPVSLALRPDGRELWVSNHVSDSVSVIDTVRGSPTRHRVVATLQELDARGATRFDEPVGIAFASDVKAYVALSSRNEIAVIDRVGERWQVRPERIRIGAQEPRAIAVRDGRLYVIPFESGNQSELSNCLHGNDPPQCTSGLLDPPRPPGEPPVFNIVRDPDVPDRDLFVFDTADDAPVATLSHVGTLLYGLAVGAGGRVYVSLTEARNDANGLQGGMLVDLDNRMFLNRIASIDCGGASCRLDPGPIELEPLPPGRPAAGRALATPYGVALSADGGTLLATAAASSRVFTLDTRSGRVRDVLDVGAIPRGVALRSHPKRGTPETAYVLDALDGTVSVVDASRPDRLRRVARIPVGSDPTPPAVRRGRIAFESAHASTSGTFACASCHPDAHVDQLLWRIGGECSPELSPLCGPHAPRSTQSIRGLRHTVPLHWDGTLGDPFGGPNGAVGTNGDGGSDCALGDADGDHDCFLDLVHGSLAGVMCDQRGACPPGGEELSGAEQDDLATFLASVWHPPARSRAVDDRVSLSASDGFADFFGDQGGVDAGTCADTAQGCHVLPLGSSTNGRNPNLGAFDAPSLRGLTDRHLQLSLGGNTTEELLTFMNDPVGLGFPFDPTPSEFPYDPARGPDERSTFTVGFMVFRITIGVGPVDIFQMVEEAGTGTSGATGRQVTLDDVTLSGELDAGTRAWLAQLEDADRRGAVALAGQATRRLPPGAGSALAVRYLAERDRYLLGAQPTTRDALLAAARAGELAVTLTAGLPLRFGEGVHRQPLLATAETGGRGITGDPPLPVLQPGEQSFAVRGIDVAEGASLLVDGAAAGGTLRCVDGDFTPFCASERLEIRLDVRPTPGGFHLVQVQNPDGPQSNELPLCVSPIGRCF